MKINMIGSFKRNHPFGTEIAFAKGLKELGHNIGLWDPSQSFFEAWNDDPDAVICFKDHGWEANTYLSTAWGQGAVTIEYQPDDIRAPGIRGMMEKMKMHCEYAFTFDSTGAEEAEKIGYKKARKLLVTADPAIYYPTADKKIFDFVFVGSLSNPTMHASRNKMIKILAGARFNVHSFSTFNVEEINRIYNSSKVVINHATDVGQEFGAGYGYQCRHFEAGLTKTCLFSNKVLGNELDGPDYFCQFWDEDSLLFWAENLIESGPEVRNNFAEGMYELIQEKHMPIHRAKEIINFIEEVK